MIIIDPHHREMYTPKVTLCKAVCERVSEADWDWCSLPPGALGLSEITRLMPGKVEPLQFVYASFQGNDDGLLRMHEGMAPHLDAECAPMSPVIGQEGTATSQQHTDSVRPSPIVTGTIEWSTIKNTRVTLFDLMDHLKQGLPPYFVAHWYHLTSEEMDEVRQFLKAHEAEIERSYAAANARAAAQRRYWEARNRHVLTSDVSQLPLPSHAEACWLALREALLAARKKCVEQPNGAHADPHRP